MIKSVLITILLFCAAINSFGQQIIYNSPKDNSSLVSLQTTITLRSDAKIDEQTVQSNLIEVSGSKSGTHSGTLKLLSDEETMIFTPSSSFSQNENVEVKLGEGIKTIDGQNLEPISFQFRTTPLSTPIPVNSLLSEGNNAIKYNSTSPIIAKKTNISDLQSNFPLLTVGTSNNPLNEKIFVTNYSFGGVYNYGHYLIIADNDGTIEKYKQLNEPSFDFKVEPNGNLSFSEFLTNRGITDNVQWIVLDTSLTAVDTFQCGNGYTANFHDFELLPNGHALLMAYDAEPIDMSKIVSGGDPNATVIGGIIQEVDASHNVVFQWRSWDYILITDSYENLNQGTVDYLHMNAIDVDSDGNILVSFRYLSQVIKINRKTGDIIWKLGGKSNEFSFINEHESNAPNYFSYQHDIKHLPNGDITLFDNGNQHSPHYSRAVEYKLDIQNKTATLVWEYRRTPDVFASAMGSVQRLSNGNTLVGWGSSDSIGSPLFTEVTPDDSVALEMFFPTGQISYRAYKFPWISKKSVAAVTAYEVLGGNTYSFNNQNDSTGVTVKFDSISGYAYPNASVALYDYSPDNPRFSTYTPRLTDQYFNLTETNINTFQGNIRIDLSKYPKITNPSQTIVYVRDKDSLIFHPLATNYNSSKNQLMVTSSVFGDYAFGIPQDIDTVYSPVPLKPENSDKVNGESSVTLRWGTKGIVSTYHLQVSLDSLFTTTVLDQSNISSTSFTISALTNNQKYFWRLQTSNESGISSWSKTFSFITSSPFISVTYPNGDENLIKDSTYIIRWDDNISDQVTIQLLKDNAPYITIDQYISSKTNAYMWNVPSNIPLDSTYKIEITSDNNSGLFGTSQNDFTIGNTITVLKNNNDIVKTYELYQNFPNPFNPTTSIKYSVPTESYVKIDIYNMIGQKIESLVNADKITGSYEVRWNGDNLSSGIYFYSINAQSKNGGEHFYKVRKMLLLK